jgi:hypothetical protein
MAKKYMTAKGYYLVSTNSPLIKNRQSQGFLIDTAQIAQMDNAQKVAEAGKTQVTVNPTSDGQQSAGGVASQYPDMEPSLKALLQLVSNRQAGLSCVELRTYTPMPGCLNALVSRFRASRAIFERHGITVIGYTVESESQTSGKLIYALASQDASAHRESWRGFAEDPEWKRMKETTEANGSLVSKIKNDFLH